MITRLDQYVGEVFAKLKAKGLDKNTVVIFTSDNGPHEEGGADPEFFGRDGKLKGLKRQCYEAVSYTHLDVYKRQTGTLLSTISELRLSLMVLCSI